MWSKFFDIFKMNKVKRIMRNVVQVIKNTNVTRNMNIKCYAFFVRWWAAADGKRYGKHRTCILLFFSLSIEFWIMIWYDELCSNTLANAVLLKNGKMAVWWVRRLLCALKIKSFALIQTTAQFHLQSDAPIEMSWDWCILSIFPILRWLPGKLVWLQWR